MAKKIIEFSAKLDTAAFEKAFQSLNQKIQNVSQPYASSKAGNMLRERMQSLGLVAPSAQDSNRIREQENLRKRTLAEMEREAQKQYRSAERLAQLEEKKKIRLDEMRKNQNVAFDEELKHKQKILKLEEDIAKIQAARQGRMNAASTAADSVEEMRTRKRNGLLTIGGDSGWSPGFGIPKIGGALGAAALGAGSAYAMAAGVGRAQRYMAGRPFELLQAQGGIGQGMAQLSGLNQIYSGQGSDMFFGGPERQRAIAMANQYHSKTSMTGRIASASKAADNVRSDMPFGFVLPGMAYLGGVLPGIASSPDKLDAAMAAMGSSSAAGRLSQLEMARTVQMAQEAETAERDKNPLKWLARQSFRENMGADFSMQTRIGLGDIGMYGQGGFLDAGMNAGLTRGEIMGSADAIIGGGGSTRAARSLSTLTGQANRAGIGSAAGSIAALSGLMGDAGSTETAFKRLLGEGVRQGLDGSEFRQENSRFQEILATTVAATGLGGVDTAGRTAGMLGSMISDRSMAGISGAQTAYGLIEDLTKGEEGVNAQIRGATIMDQYGYLDLGGKSFLQNAGISSLTEDNPRLRAVYEQAKSSGDATGSFSDFVAQVREDMGSSMTVNAGTREAMDKYRSAYSGFTSRGMSQEQIGQQPETGQLLNALALDIGSTRFNGMNAKAQSSFASFVGRGNFGGAMGLLDGEGAAVDSRLASGTPSVAQSELQGVARSQKLVNDQFVEMIGSMEKAADSMKKLNRETFELMTRIENMQTSGAVMQRIPEAGKASQ